MGILHNQQRSTPVRRTLRKNITEPEQRLWYFLRNSRLNGYKFKRQYSIGRYVVDFYCAKIKLAIEIDGDSHFTDDAQSHDKERTEYLNKCNVRVARYTNDEVMKSIHSVIQNIALNLPSP